MLNSVQYLRAIAATMVVIYHVLGEVYGARSNDNFSIVMFSGGVDLFFVISGFVMFQSTADKTLAPHEFIRARLIRIVPLYWCATLAALAYFPLVQGKALPAARDIVLSLLFIPYSSPTEAFPPVLHPGWTLNYEMFFYALFACSLMFRRPNSRVMLVAASIAILVALKPMVAHWGEAARVYTSGLMLEFLMGVCIGVLHRRGAITHGGWLVLAGIAMALVFMGHNGLGTPRMVHFGLPASLIFAGMLSMENKVQRIAWLALVGDASYSIYLSHAFTVDLLQRFVPLRDAPAAMVLGVVMLSLIAGIVVYRVAEQPMLRWARSLRPAAVLRGRTT